MTSGWVVFLLGSPLPFEEMATYRARIKRERFDLDMLNRYCEALGIARSNDRFYCQHAVAARIPSITRRARFCQFAAEVSPTAHGVTRKVP